MKDHGSPDLTGGDVWRQVRCPVLKVTVTLVSLHAQKQSEALLFATVHHKELVRALWTAKGASQMEVTIDIQPRLTHNSPRNRDLLQPFFELCDSKRDDAVSASKLEYLDLLPRLSSITDDINCALGELTISIKCLQEYIKARRWEQAIMQAEEHAAFLSDCNVV